MGFENVVPGNAWTSSIKVPITRSMMPPTCGRPGGRQAMAMPCCPQPRSKAAEWNSLALSTPIRAGLPATGQLAVTPIRSSQGAFSAATWVRHRPTLVAEGGSSVRWKPAMQRLWTSTASVTHGRPIGWRSTGSTRMRSTFVWSIWMKSKG